MTNQNHDDDKYPRSSPHHLLLELLSSPSTIFRRLHDVLHMLLHVELESLKEGVSENILKSKVGDDYLGWGDLDPALYPQLLLLLRVALPLRQG